MRIASTGACVVMRADISQVPYRKPAYRKRCVPSRRLCYPVRAMSAEQNSQLDVLAIAAHPDDVELSVGGTLIKLARMGYRTGILDMTHGESGTRGTPEIRAQEAERAARILGVAV